MGVVQAPNIATSHQAGLSNSFTKTPDIHEIVFDVTNQVLYALSKKQLEALEEMEKTFEEIAQRVIDVQKLESITDAEKEKKEIQKALSALGVKPNSSKDLTEIRRLKGKRSWTYVPETFVKETATRKGHKRKGHTKSFSLETTDAKRSIMTDGKIDYTKLKMKMLDPKTNTSDSLAVKAFKNTKATSKWVVLDEHPPQAFMDWANTYNDGIVFGEDNPKQKVNTYGGVQWMRFSSGVGIDGQMDLLKGKVSGNFKSDATMELLSGEANLKITFPEEADSKLKFKMPLKKKLKDTNKYVYTQEDTEIDMGNFIFEVLCSLSGFAGASIVLEAHATIDLDKDKAFQLIPLSKLSKQKREEAEQKRKEEERKNRNKKSLGGTPLSVNENTGADAKAEFFAGAKLGCDIAGEFKWKNPEEKKYVSLAGLKAGAQIGAGLAGEAEFKITYEDGRFMLRGKASLICGLGGGGKVGLEVDPAKIIMLVQFTYHALMNKDYAYMDFIEEKAFHALSYLAVESLTKVHTLIEDSYDDLKGLIDDFQDAWISQTKRQAESKAVAKLVLEDKQNLVRFLTPEAKGRLIAILCRKFWVKEKGDTKFAWDAEERQEDAILVILSWIQSKDEARRVFERVTEENSIRLSESEGRDKVSEALDGLQSLKYYNWKRSWYANLNKKSKTKGKPVKQWDISIF